jgi:hypothetical protein
MADTEIKSNNTMIVKECPLKLCNVNKDFFYGGAAALLLGVGYWFVRCRGRTV